MKLELVLSRAAKYLKDKNAQLRYFVPGVDEVPVSGTKFHYMDIISLLTAALSEWVTEGKYCSLMEYKLSKYTSINHFILTNSGSSANLVAMSAMKEFYEICDRKLVITSALAFPTTVAPIIQAGFVPYFVDVDRRTLNPRPEDLIELSTRQDVAGAIISHTLGFPVPLLDVETEFRRNHKFLIEDCCDAMGATVQMGEHVGHRGDIATFSFFPAHHISTGEGGAIGTYNGRLCKILHSYVNWGRDCWCKPGENNTCGKRFEQKFPKLPDHFDHKYVWSRLGYNMKMTDLQAALGSSQMDRVEDIVQRRRDNYAYLYQGFESITRFYSYFRRVENEFGFSPFGFPLSCVVTNRSHVIQFLEGRHIRTRPIFAGNITRHPMMDSINYMTFGALEGCDYVTDNSFWIGCHPELTKVQLDYVIESFRDYINSL